MTTGTTPGTTPEPDGRNHHGNHPPNPCDCRPVPPPVPPGTTTGVLPGTGTTHVVGTGPGTTSAHNAYAFVLDHLDRVRLGLTLAALHLTRRKP